MKPTVDIYHALDDSKQHLDTGTEYWEAFDIATLLGFKIWRNFSRGLYQSMADCLEAGQSIEAHFYCDRPELDPGTAWSLDPSDMTLTRYAGELVSKLYFDSSWRPAKAIHQYFKDTLYHHAQAHFKANQPIELATTLDRLKQTQGGEAFWYARDVARPLGLVQANSVIRLIKRALGYNATLNV